MDDDDRLIPDPEVRKRYGGISEMTLWRWDHDPALNFPKPVRIRNRKYRRLRELHAWEVKRAGRSAA
jgi:predicted DNA-binding transcriptional regulator AlpA